MKNGPTDNPIPLRKLFRAVLKDAMRGSLLFSVLTAIAMFGNLGWLYFWAAVPGDLLWSHIFTKPETANPFDSSFLYYSYCVIVNAIFGAFVFPICHFILFALQDILADSKKNRGRKDQISLKK